MNMKETKEMNMKETKYSGMALEYVLVDENYVCADVSEPDEYPFVPVVIIREDWKECIKKSVEELFACQWLYDVPGHIPTITKVLKLLDECGPWDYYPFFRSIADLIEDDDEFWELMEQGADPIPGPTELVPSIGKRRKRLFEEKAWNKILLEGHLAAEQSYYKKIFETYPINRILGEY